MRQPSPASSCCEAWSRWIQLAHCSFCQFLKDSTAVPFIFLCLRGTWWSMPAWWNEVQHQGMISKGHRAKANHPCVKLSKSHKTWEGENESQGIWHRKPETLLPSDFLPNSAPTSPICPDLITLQTSHYVLALLPPSHTKIPSRLTSQYPTQTLAQATFVLLPRAPIALT